MVDPVDPKTYVGALARASREAAFALAAATGGARDAALRACAAALRRARPALQAANENDLAAAQDAKLAPAMIDRLRLTDKAVEGMAAALEQIALMNQKVTDSESFDNGTSYEREISYSSGGVNSRSIFPA